LYFAFNKNTTQKCVSKGQKKVRQISRDTLHPAVSTYRRGLSGFGRVNLLSYKIRLSLGYLIVFPGAAILIKLYPTRPKPQEDL